MIAITLIVIMLQVRSFSMMTLVMLTAPLGLVGAVPILLAFNQPFGFKATPIERSSCPENRLVVNHSSTVEAHLVGVARRAAATGGRMSDGYSGWHGSGDRGRRAAAQRRPGNRGPRREIEHGAGHRSRAETARCPYCGGSALSRFGRTPRGAQRWHCRTCGRKHQATTGTALAGVRQPHKFHALIADMLGAEPSSCRRLARELELDKSTVWQWRQRAARGFVVPDRTTLTAPLARGVAVVRESRKASREWVNHRRDPEAHPEPDRLRWVDYRRLGLVAPDHLPRYRIPIEISVDRLGRRTAEVLDPNAAEHWPPAISAAPTADQQAARTSATLAIPHNATGDATQPSYGPSSGAGAVDRGLAKLRWFLRPFRGPATRHLPAYVAWFVTRMESGELPRAMTAGCPTRYPSPAPA